MNVALILFRRPDATQRVFAEIAKARPERLFLIADGPRPDRPGEAEQCAAARAVVEKVDWPCEVFRNYSPTNLGCGLRPATGISWVFEHVEDAIILEDDCVPHPSFFRFCQDLLERYREDERVMQVSANNFQFGKRRSPYSYFFSCHPICWGWASWRRAWKHFNMELKLWPLLRDTKWLYDVIQNEAAVEYWSSFFNEAHALKGKVDYWDYQWAFACWSQSGLSISPSRTLVTNIGFGSDASHTIGSADRRAYLGTEEMAFPLYHPPCVVRDYEADQIFLEELVLPNLPREASLYHRVRSRCASALPAGLRKQLADLKARLAADA